MRHPITIVEGPYGQLLVHRESGHIIEREVYDEDEDRYADVAAFVPSSLPDQERVDIRHVSFLTRGGEYRLPLHDVSPKWWLVPQYRSLAALPAPS